MFYTGVDSLGNQRTGRVTTGLLDTTNTQWSVNDRKMVFAADSTSWVVRHPPGPDFNGASQFRDPFIFPDPDSIGRFVMVYTGMDSNYKTQQGLSVGVARNRSGTLDRWRDLGRYGVTDFGRNGHKGQVESPHLFPDTASVSKWRVMYTWGGNHPQNETIRFAPDSLTTSITDTASVHWGANRILFDYLGSDTTVSGWNGTEHLRAGTVDFLAAYNAYVVDGIQIARMYWSGRNFSLKQPSVTAVDYAGAATRSVKLSLEKFAAHSQMIEFQVYVPAALRVNLSIYDVLGRRLSTIIDGDLPKGISSVRWDKTSRDGRKVPSGMYFARLNYKSGNRVAQFPILR